MEIGNEISQQIRVSVLNQLSLKFIGILDYFDYNYVLILNYGQLAINCVLEMCHLSNKTENSSAVCL